MKLFSATAVLLAVLALSATVDAYKCDDTCVYGYNKDHHTCPHFCKKTTCRKGWRIGVTCVPKHKPSPSPSPSTTPLPKGCAEVCVATPWKYGYKCPHYCVEKSCHKWHQKGIKCVPKPSPSPTPLPKGCAEVCVATPWKYGYKCPHYCLEKSCHKYHQKGIKCVPYPSPSPTPLPKGCADVCIPTPMKFGYKCPHYCLEKSCHKYHKKGIKCVPYPSPSPSPKPKPACEDKCTVFGKHKVKSSCNPHLCVVEHCKKWLLKGLTCVKKPKYTPHKPKMPCSNKCMPAHMLKKIGCNEDLCHVVFCKTTSYKQNPVKCAPLH